MTGATAFSVEGLCLSAGAIVRRAVSVDGARIGSTSQGPVWRLAPDEILIPAFHDHHTHLIGAYRPPRGPDLRDCGTRQECLDGLALWLREHPGVDPVIGEGWDESAWDDPRPLTRSDIDPIAPARPVALRRVCGHIAVLNRSAWEALCPEGEEADETTGRLKESLAMGLLQRWPASAEEDLEGARRGQEAAHRYGVAAIDEMGRIETYQAFRRLEEAGGLRLRVNHYFPLEKVHELIDRGLTPATPAVGPLRVAGLKGFLDGSIGGRTAAMVCRYRDTSSPGMLLWETDPLAALVEEGVRAGFGIAVHAIGLRAVEQALTVFERAVRTGFVRSRLRIEHAEELDDRAMARAASLGVALSMQPNFTARWQGQDGMYERALGREERISLNRFGSASRSTSVLFGSDTMPFGPLGGIVGAIAHPLAHERLALPLALRAYMPEGIGPAAGRELLANGERADLAILRAPDGHLDRSLREGRASVIWLALSGQVAFSDPSAGAPAALAECSR